ncbi:hypothetical protein PsYK624_133200 [Phanerochaete sordida]|uniref:F-box domain-containing protein n=1 Tax=Phanerochaete sordida TaxID=48140 RepID=A0A9P3GMS5_9APHY|nr:hypothetical protein PsYK624_133200 [Phanerochaete sordida]
MRYALTRRAYSAVQIDLYVQTLVICKDVPEEQKVRTLQSVSLVSKRCSLVAQYELFHRIFVVFGYSANEIVLRGLEEAWERLEPLNRAVRRLTIKARSTVAEAGCGYYSTVRPELCEFEVHAILFLFPGVATLDIIAFKWVIRPPPPTRPVASLERLTILRLSYLDFRNIGETDPVNHIVQLLPRIRTLEFTGCISHQVVPPFLRACSGVTTLIVDCTKRTIFTPFTLLPRLIGVRHIEVRHMDDYDVAMLGLQILSNASTLKSICIRLDRWMTHQDLQVMANYDIGLDVCHILESFEFHFPCPRCPDVVYANAASSKAVLFLSKLPPTVQEVILVFDGFRRTQSLMHAVLCLMRWDDILRSINDHSLRKVTLVLGGRPLGADTYSWSARLNDKLDQNLSHGVAIAIVADNGSGVREYSEVARKGSKQPAARSTNLSIMSPERCG